MKSHLALFLYIGFEKHWFLSVFVCSCQMLFRGETPIKIEKNKNRSENSEVNKASSAWELRLKKRKLKSGRRIYNKLKVYPAENSDIKGKIEKQVGVLKKKVISWC